MTADEPIYLAAFTESEWAQVIHGLQSIPGGGDDLLKRLTRIKPAAYLSGVQDHRGFRAVHVEAFDLGASNVAVKRPEGRTQ